MGFCGEGGGERGSDWRGCFTFSAVSCVCEGGLNRILQVIKALRGGGGGEQGRCDKMHSEQNVTSRHVELNFIL